MITIRKIDSATQDLLHDLQGVLEEFQKVFASPTKLSSHQPQDYAMPLLPNQPPVSVHSYRYLHYQKSKIEKLVKEFLDSRLIRPSNSPFSSPVLLVKKADGTWHFCVNF